MSKGKRGKIAHVVGLGWVGGREGGREEGREGGRERGREGGRKGDGEAFV